MARAIMVPGQKLKVSLIQFVILPDFWTQAEDYDTHKRNLHLFFVLFF